MAFTPQNPLVIFFFFSCIKITVMGISWNNKEITPLLLEIIQKHKEGLQLRNITVTAARPCLIIVSCCIDLITALLCSEKGIFPFCPTLPWPFLTEESWVGGSEVSTSMEHVCEGGWAASKGTQSIFYENSLMQSSLSFPSVQTNVLLLPYHASDVIALLPAGLTDPSVSLTSQCPQQADGMSAPLLLSAPAQSPQELPTSEPKSPQCEWESCVGCWMRHVPITAAHTVSSDNLSILKILFLKPWIHFRFVELQRNKVHLGFQNRSQTKLLWGI